jgi:hypothetical protein
VLSLPRRVRERISLPLFGQETCLTSGGLRCLKQTAIAPIRFNFRRSSGSLPGSNSKLRLAT